MYLEEWGLFLLLSQHSGKKNFVAFLRQHLQAQGELCTSVLTLSEMLHIATKALTNKSLQQLHFYIKELEDLFEEILPVEHRDLQRAFTLQEKYGCSLTEALHISLIQAHGIEALAAPRQPYASLVSVDFFPLPNV